MVIHGEQCACCWGTFLNLTIERIGYSNPLGTAFERYTTDRPGVVAMRVRARSTKTSHAHQVNQRHTERCASSLHRASRGLAWSAVGRLVSLSKKKTLTSIVCNLPPRSSSFSINARSFPSNNGVSLSWHLSFFFSLVFFISLSRDETFWRIQSLDMLTSNPAKREPIHVARARENTHVTNKVTLMLILSSKGHPTESRMLCLMKKHRCG